MPAPANFDGPFEGEDERLGAPVRDHVTFRQASAAAFEPMDAATDFVRQIRSGNKERSPPIKARTHRSYSGAVTVRISRYSDRFHTITISSTADGGLLARHNVTPGRDLSLLLHEWLCASDRFTDICWRTRDQWRNGDAGAATPI